MSRPPASKSRGGGEKTGSRGAPGAQPVAPTTLVNNDIIPGRLTEVDWLRLLAEDDDSNFLGSIVDEILDDTLDKCYDKYIENQLIPYTVNYAKNSILQIVDWHFLSRDVGEINITNDEGWKEDSEPEAGAIDSWAQGSVPVVVRPQSSLAASVSAISEGHTFVPEPVETTDAVEEDAASFPIELESTEDQTVTEEDAQPVNTGTKLPSKKLPVKPSPPKGKSKQLPTIPEKKRKRSYKKHTGRLPPLPSSEFDAVPSGKLDVDDSSKAGMHLSPSQKSLIKSQAGRPPGNREVTFDERGNVIGVMKLNVQTLPTHRVRVQYSVIDPAAEANSKKLTGLHFLRSQREARSERKTEVAKSVTTEKTRLTQSRNKTESSASYKTRDLALTVQQFPPNQSMIRSQKDVRSVIRERKVMGARIDPLPPLLIDTIDASPGVVIQEGDQIKKGPEEQHPINVARSLYRRIPDPESVLRLLGDRSAPNNRPMLDPVQMVHTVRGAPDQTVFAVSPRIQDLTVKPTAEV